MSTNHPHLFPFTRFALFLSGAVFLSNADAVMAKMIEIQPASGPIVSQSLASPPMGSVKCSDWAYVKGSPSLHKSANTKSLTLAQLQPKQLICVAGHGAPDKNMNYQWFLVIPAQPNAWCQAHPTDLECRELFPPRSQANPAHPACQEININEENYYTKSCIRGWVHHRNLLFLKG